MEHTRDLQLHPVFGAYRVATPHDLYRFAVEKISLPLPLVQNMSLKQRICQERLKHSRTIPGNHCLLMSWKLGHFAPAVILCVREDYFHASCQHLPDNSHHQLRYHQVLLARLCESSRPRGTNCDSDVSASAYPAAPDILDVDHSDILSKVGHVTTCTRGSTTKNEMLEANWRNTTIVAVHAHVVCILCCLHVNRVLLSKYTFWSTMTI